MGNYVIKYLPRNAASEEQGVEVNSPSEEETIQENCLQTPPVCQRLPIDPRSVTAEIQRTPIEVKSTPLGSRKRIITAIPSHLQRKPYLETDIDRVLPTLAPRKRFGSNLDAAQSPSTSENQDANDHLTQTLKPLNHLKIITEIDRERYEILGLDPRSPAADFARTPMLMPKSLQRLRLREKELLSRRGSYETDMCSTISYCETVTEYNIPEIQLFPDMVVNLVKSLNLEAIDSHDETNDSDSSHSSYSSKIEFASASSEENTVIENQKPNANEETGLNSISAEKNPQTEEDPKPSGCNTVHVERDTQNKQMVVNDSDKIRVWRDSLSSEDADEIDLAESENTEISKEKVTQLSKIRTPLGNRSNNGQMKILSAKSPQQLFKNKGMTTKMLQENTPPHKKHIAKSKLSGIHWDPDSTVII